MMEGVRESVALVKAWRAWGKALHTPQEAKYRHRYYAMKGKVGKRQRLRIAVRIVKRREQGCGKG